MSHEIEQEPITRKPGPGSLRSATASSDEMVEIDSPRDQATDDSIVTTAELDPFAGGPHDFDIPLGGDGDGDGEPPPEHVTFSKEGFREETEMDMTPMVDVTFLLLIFFMVTAAFSLQKKLDVPTPKPDEPSSNPIQLDQEDDPSTVTVIVDEFNTYQVITVDWEAEAPSEQELLIKLREARGGNRSGKQPSKLLIKAHGDALHERVVFAMDSGTEVGMDEVQLMSFEGDEY